MPTLKIELTDRDLELIQSLVESGTYWGAGDVVHEALQLLDLHARHEDVKLAALHAAVQDGIDDIEQGHYKEFQSARAAADYLREVTKKVLAEGAAKQP